jgi:tRNA threonylcarbamoyladenosine biosynthesis protein TsaB
MNILAIDSTAIVASVALCDDDKLIALYTVNNGNTHSETLLPMVESILKQAKLTASDIGLFAVSNGPGSFTGVRIGCATTKGLAFGREVPCIGVSTLEALAYNLKGTDGIICPVMNARRNQVYNALFKFENGKLVRLCPDRAIAIKDLVAELEANEDLKNQKIYLTGDGCDITAPAIPEDKLGYTHPMMTHQNAYSVAMCALESYKAGVGIVSDLELAPTYLRPSQAERERMEKLEKGIN